MEKIKGLLVAPFTAFTEDNQINTAVIPQYAALLKRNGLSGVFINGSKEKGTIYLYDKDVIDIGGVQFTYIEKYMEE